MEKHLEEVGEHLRRLRKQAGYKSYSEFAWEHGIDKSQYGRMEKGTNCTLNSLKKVLEIHKLTFAQFFNLFSD